MEPGSQPWSACSEPTSSATGGLPVHIAAKILGHYSLATAETYLAAFQDDLISTHRAHLSKRRPERPEAE